MMTQLVPAPEPEFVRGRPNIYGIYHPNANGWYIGRNLTGDLDYKGSPGDEACKEIADVHKKLGLPIVREKHCLWSPPGVTPEECGNQEWIWIRRFREGHDGPVFNKFPIQDWTNHFRWDHDPETHVDRATNSRWPVMYVMMNSRPDAAGDCVPHAGEHRCGRQWGEHESGLYWCKKIHLDERNRVEWIYPPTRGRSQQAPYDAFRRDKLKMIHGEDNEVA